MKKITIVIILAALYCGGISEERRNQKKEKVLRMAAKAYEPSGEESSSPEAQLADLSISSSPDIDRDEIIIVKNDEKPSMDHSFGKKMERVESTLSAMAKLDLLPKKKS